MTSLPLCCSGQLIGSTVSWWLMEILIQPPAFLFVCYWGDFFSSALHPQVHLKDGPSHSDVCHTNPKRTDPFFSFFFFFLFFSNHANYCGANPDCCCHGNCLSGVTAPLKLKWMRKWEEVGDRLQRRHTRTHPRLIMCQHISCSILFRGVYDWQFTLTPNDLTAARSSASMPENESDAGEWG